MSQDTDSPKSQGSAGNLKSVMTKKTDNEEQDSISSEMVGVITRNTGFRKVIFSERVGEGEPRDPSPGVNGVVLKFQRGKPCIVPECHLDVLRNAIHNRYAHTPGEGRKVKGRIKRFTWQDLGPATYDEFKIAYDTGTQKTREAVAKHGLNMPIEEAVPQDL